MVIVVALSICEWIVIIVFGPITRHWFFQEKLLSGAVDGVSLKVYVFYLFKMRLVLPLLGKPAKNWSVGDDCICWIGSSLRRHTVALVLKLVRLGGHSVVRITIGACIVTLTVIGERRVGLTLFSSILQVAFWPLLITCGFLIITSCHDIFIWVSSISGPFMRGRSVLLLSRLARLLPVQLAQLARSQRQSRFLSHSFLKCLILFQAVEWVLMFDNRVSRSDRACFNFLVNFQLNI